MGWLRRIIDRWYYRRNPKVLLGECLVHFPANYGEILAYIQATTLEEKWAVVFLMCLKRVDAALQDPSFDAERLHHHREYKRHLLNLGLDLELLRLRY